MPCVSKQNQIPSSTIKTVLFPIRNIVLNVFRNCIQFIDIPNDMVMETRLPIKFDIVIGGIRLRANFYPSNDGRQIFGLW